MAVKTEAAPYLDAFRADALEPAWLATARRAALDAFGARGFPSRREEAWRFTSLRPLADTFYPPVVDGAAARLPHITPAVAALLRRCALSQPSHRLVFINGRLQAAPDTLPAGLRLGSLIEIAEKSPELAQRAIEKTDLEGGQPFAALNAGLFADGFVIEVGEGVRLDRPIEIIHVADAAAPVSIHLRNLVVIRAGAAATLVETYIGRGGGAYWANAVTQVDVQENSSLKHIMLQDEANSSLHFGNNRVSLGEASKYDNFLLTTGAALSRQDIAVAVGPGAQINLAGAYLQRGDQDTTNAILIDHLAPGGQSREIFKGVLDERAHGAFLGTIRVREAAQQTDARQTSRALLLSNRASVETKPELAILADDVKCAHGAAVGDIDRETLFYLRARGIGTDEARRMLIEAFVLETIEAVDDPALREHLSRAVRSWLDHA